MARKRKVTTKSPNVVGRPGYTETGMKKRLGTIRPFKARGIKTLIKRDESKGITMPESSVIERQPGQITPGAHPTIVHQQPQVPDKTGTNQRVVAAPSPTGRAGVRSPFNPKKRVGRGSGKNTRIK